MLPVGLVIRVINSTREKKKKKKKRTILTAEWKALPDLLWQAKEQNPDSFLWCNKERRSQNQNGYPQLSKPQNKSKQQIWKRNPNQTEKENNRLHHELRNPIKMFHSVTLTLLRNI